MNKFFLEIITPEKTFYRGEVEGLDIPAIGGEFSRFDAPVLASR